MFDRAFLTRASARVVVFVGVVACVFIVVCGFWGTNNELGNTNYSVGAPAFIGADLNRYYNTYERTPGVIAKSPPKMLSDYGWTDLRYADTGFRQTVHACAVDSTCKKFATIPEGRSVLDYIFAIYDHAWTPGKFTTLTGSVWYSDHKMITGDIWIRG